MVNNKLILNLNLLTSYIYAECDFIKLCIFLFRFWRNYCYLHFL